MTKFTTHQSGALFLHEFSVECFLIPMVQKTQTTSQVTFYIERLYNSFCFSAKTEGYEHILDDYDCGYIQCSQHEEY